MKLSILDQSKNFGESERDSKRRLSLVVAKGKSGNRSIKEGIFDA
ncbi:hypothetical protein [Salibacterium salarium]|nr:hypothetical protein [Salibacterium salarium]